jgi:eukaryotic-like serine/threonine-protein kinase
MSVEPPREETILEQALTFGSKEARLAYLQGACGGDKRLRARVESLIEAHEAAGGFLKSREHGTNGLAATVLLPVTEKPGDRIGRYKLLQQIGEGGCGVVYMAEQEEPVRRRVALKVIKLGMDTKSVIARFEAERQALALMDHPNIAKVLDAGATKTGRPYFVMELVRGIKITDYCDQNNLSTRERLDLFIQVCHAIQHAHQKGIIHRDIKPSNILVSRHDGVPVPVVIDFGIAKATEQRLTEKTLFTAFEQFIGTPAYTSPEQAGMSRLDIDTRSDIYSLGVLLYELLTGKTPFDSRELLAAGLDEMRRTIREKEPARPSTRLNTLQGEELTTTAKRRGTEAPRLIQLVRGDLDWIVMKCLEKERTRRYETANGLALDLERHLSDEPVTARPPNRAYRVQKFVRRNKVIVTAGTAVAAALVLGTVVSTWQAVRARRLQVKAETSQQRALQAQTKEAQQRQAAEDARRLAEQQSYCASIGQAQALIEQGQYGRARQVLAEPGLASRRGWEWGWLERSCNLDLMTFSSGGVWLTGVAFSPDGRWLAAGAFDGTARLWDLTVGSPPRLLRGHAENSKVVLLGFSPDSRRLVTSCVDGTAKVWDMTSGQSVFTLAGHSNAVYCALYSPDGKTIATGGEDRTVRLWNAADAAPLGIAGEYGDTVLCVAFSPDGRHLAYGGGNLSKVPGPDNTVRILDLETRRARKLTGHSHCVSAIAFSPDGRQIFTSSWDMTARRGDVRTDGELHAFFEGRGFGGLLSLALSPDGALCALGGGVMGQQRAEAGVHIIDVRSGGDVRVLEGHARPIRGVAFSPDGTRIATASVDGTVKIWPGKPFPEYLSLEGHDQAVWTVAVSPDGQRMATGSLDQTAKVWELETGRLLLILPVNFPVISLAFSPDSRRLITVGSEATARVWDLAPSGGATNSAASPFESVLTLQGHLDAVTCVAYGPCGRRLATGSKDGTARLWDARFGQ